MSLAFTRSRGMWRWMLPLLAAAVLFALAGPVLARHDEFGGGTGLLAFAPYTETYAPYAAGPVMHESDLTVYAPYTEPDYAPYAAGPVMHESDLTRTYPHYPIE